MCTRLELWGSESGEAATALGGTNHSVAVNVAAANRATAYALVWRSDIRVFALDFREWPRPACDAPCSSNLCLQASLFLRALPVRSNDQSRGEVPESWLADVPGRGIG